MTTAGPAPATVSTHVLDTSTGRPAPGVPVSVSARAPGTSWAQVGASGTDRDGRCKDLPALPEGTTHARLDFVTEAYLTARTGERPGHRQPAGPHGAFFPEVTVTFAVTPGEHYHVPLLLNPFGYSVYRGS